ncbi:MAG TPA: CAP domain-containing protein [Chthoniobacteraceae bacterium]|nr:CAP domain-containing protein [Chthoniobacteraceae bacterium]
MTISRFLLSLALTFAAGVAAQAGVSEQVLAEMNLARTQPQQYAQYLAAESRPGRDTEEAIRFLQKAKPLPPLGSSIGLGQSSMLHVSTQGPIGGRGHGGFGNSPFTRMNKFGQYVGYAGENIYYGRGSARSIVCTLIVDAGVSDRGHRKNIFSANYGVAGVATGPHATYGSLCVIDFAGQYVERGATAGL